MTERLVRTLVLVCRGANVSVEWRMMPVRRPGLYAYWKATATK